METEPKTEVVAAPPAPTALAQQQVPTFTCIVCDEIYLPTSFKKDDEGRVIPRLSGHRLLKTPGQILCGGCIRESYEELRAGMLGSKWP